MSKIILTESVVPATPSAGKIALYVKADKVIYTLDDAGVEVSWVGAAGLVDGDFGTSGLMTTDGAGAYSVTTNASANWNTAFGWGNHASAGYLTSFSETNDLTAAVTWDNVPIANIPTGTSGTTVALGNHTHEGTAILSTGEAGGTKYLREDGDGSCSWQAVAGGTPEGTAILSTGETTGKVLQADGDDTCSWVTLSGGGDALVANPLSQFAATTSAQLAGIISDETGSGALAFATSPTLVTPVLGTPASGVLTNCTGLPLAGLAGGTDGELITWDASGNAAAVAVGTATHVLTSNGAGAAPTFQAAGGSELGSRLAGIDSRTAFEAERGADEGYDEEFDGVGVSDNTLPTDWVWVNQDAAVYREGYGQGRVDFAGGGDTSNLHAVVQPFAETSYDAIAHLLGSTQGHTCYTGGLCLYNSSNGDFVTLAQFQPGANQAAQFYVGHYTDADTYGSTLGGPVTLYPMVGEHCYYRVIKTSNTAYQFQVSPDGGCWFNVGSSLDLTATIGVPTHIGFFLNSPNASHMGCEWLRIRDLP